MKRKFLLLFSVITLLSVNVLPASAQFTLLPQAPEGADCKELLDLYEQNGDIPNQLQLATATKNSADDALTAAKEALAAAGKSGDAEAIAKAKVALDEAETASAKRKADYDKEKAAMDEANRSTLPTDKDGDFGALLGCAIKTGRVSLQMIPHFISFFANFLLALSALISVLFIVIGGFMYIYGGLTDNKERGKKYIYHALLGMVLALMAWTIVSVIMIALTS